MGNRPDPRKRGNDEETRARKEKAGTSERDVLRWQPPQLRELTSNEKSRPRRRDAFLRRIELTESFSLCVQFSRGTNENTGEFAIY